MRAAFSIFRRFCIALYCFALFRTVFPAVFLKSGPLSVLEKSAFFLFHVHGFKARFGCCLSLLQSLRKGASKFRTMRFAARRLSAAFASKPNLFCGPFPQKLKNNKHFLRQFQGSLAGLNWLLRGNLMAHPDSNTGVNGFKARFGCCLSPLQSLRKGALKFRTMRFAARRLSAAFASKPNLFCGPFPQKLKNNKHFLRQFQGSLAGLNWLLRGNLMAHPDSNTGVNGFKACFGCCLSPLQSLRKGASKFRTMRFAARRLSAAFASEPAGQKKGVSKQQNKPKTL